MKKKKMQISSAFSIAEEMLNHNGEDSFCYRCEDEKFLIASFDGLGGSGAKKYENYSLKTGAYIASRAVCGAVNAWFDSSKDVNKFSEYVESSLNVCKEYADKNVSRIKNSFSKAFPTTASVIYGEVNKNKLDVTCFWAGDSRCYMLDADGLHQLSTDDISNQDAMSNLRNDGIMTNVINASASFEIHKKKISFSAPCIFLTATDGCFGYLASPMAFEQLLTDSLVKSDNLRDWKIALNEKMHDVAGDDYTLSVAIYGFNDFKEIKSHFKKRNDYVYKTYIKAKNDVENMWEIYKKGYYTYI